MNIDGIILVQKPQGVGPFDCTNKVKEAFDMTQVSHIESLEPRVEGVLPIFTGKATKLLRLFKGGIREYSCEITLGYSTTTEDITGEIIDQAEIKRKPSAKRVEKILASMLGEHSQISPMYSASMYKGKKLHKYLEEGVTIPEKERPVRHVEILDIALETEIVRTEADLVKFSCYIKCTDGTFIRSLAVAIGKELGHPAHMSRLKRLAVGPFKLAEAADYETFVMRLSILSSDGKGSISFSNKKKQTWFIPYEEILKSYPRIPLSNDEEAQEIERKIRKGKKIPYESLKTNTQPDEPFILTTLSNEPIAIYALAKDSQQYYSFAVL